MAHKIDTSGDLNADRRYRYAQDLLVDKDYASALDLLTQTAELIPNWPPLWFTTGETHLSLGDKNLAAKAFQKALTLDPDDRLGASLKLAQITGLNLKAIMSPAYVAALFDQYADRFDEHLTKALNYKGPDILFEALLRHCENTNRNFHFKRAADLGCGTGLMAEKLSKNVDVFYGVDLSEQMVKQARKAGHYNEVTCDDIVRYLSNKQTHSFDLLIAADVLVYIGDLAKLFKQVAQSIAADGLFAFTVQSTQANGFQLGQDMRYHHSANYLVRTAQTAGLKIGAIKECITRQDAGQPVPGFVVIISPG